MLASANSNGQLSAAPSRRMERDARAPMVAVSALYIGVSATDVWSLHPSALKCEMQIKIEPTTCQTEFANWYGLWMGRLIKAQAGVLQ